MFSEEGIRVLSLSKGGGGSFCVDARSGFSSAVGLSQSESGAAAVLVHSLTGTAAHGGATHHGGAHHWAAHWAGSTHAAHATHATHHAATHAAHASHATTHAAHASHAAGVLNVDASAHVLVTTTLGHGTHHHLLLLLLLLLLHVVGVGLSGLLEFAVQLAHTLLDLLGLVTCLLVTLFHGFLHLGHPLLELGGDGLRLLVLLALLA